MNRVHRSYTSRGFTVVELLIVIVVIGILAAITIVAYNGIQNQASETGTTSDLRNFSNKMETFSADRGRYPASPAELATLDLKFGDTYHATSPTVTVNLLYCTNTSRTTFSMLSTTKSGKRFYIANGTKTTEYTGAVSWNTTDYTARCNSVHSNTSTFSAGYNAADTSTGPWRSWTNVSN